MDYFWFWVALFFFVLYFFTDTVHKNILGIIDKHAYVEDGKQRDKDGNEIPQPPPDISPPVTAMLRALKIEEDWTISNESKPWEYTGFFRVVHTPTMKSFTLLYYNMRDDSYAISLDWLSPDERKVMIEAVLKMKNDKDLRTKQEINAKGRNEFMVFEQEYPSDPV